MSVPPRFGPRQPEHELPLHGNCFGSQSRQSMASRSSSNPPSARPACCSSGPQVTSGSPSDITSPPPSMGSPAPFSAGNPLPSSSRCLAPACMHVYRLPTLPRLLHEASADGQSHPSCRHGACPKKDDWRICMSGLGTSPARKTMQLLKKAMLSPRSAAPVGPALEGSRLSPPSAHSAP